MKTQSLPSTFPPGFMLSITDAAAAQVASAIEQYGLSERAGLKVGVEEGGCSGLNYDVRVIDGPEDDDETFVLSATNVFVNPFSAKHVSGMEVNWISSMQESRFTFTNPNATGGCGCGVSFTTE